ncbi:thermonuclease family protein [Candidatus Saccharibacteria bacterium]|nr:thermonuclease family protein [Candidatus Saccharibacteria bacterium]
MDARAKKKLIRVLSSILVGLVLVFAQKQGWLGQSGAPNTGGTVAPGMYRVVKFDDGDTIAVNMEGRTETIRFIGVDTPETHDPRKPVQCYGKTASAFTKKTIGTQNVRLEADPESGNRDRYNRLLRFVYLPDGTLLNQKLVAEGYGFAITGFPHTKMAQFVDAEKIAIDEKRGLWGSCQIEVVKGINRTAPE